MITIINYGLGNIQAFVNVYKRLHIPVSVAKTAEEVKNSSKLILPGVGAFDHAMEQLNGSGMRESLDEAVLVNKIPVLGICVGMQMLTSSSDEGSLPGLDWIPGQVKSFRSIPSMKELPLPHMGWNDVVSTAGCPLFKDIEHDSRFYFLHSYFFECLNEKDIAARANYGFDFCCAVSADNIYGVQCHPEKSHHFGVTLLKNFAEL